MSKNSYITVTDQFCGAGGSSQGAVAAGVEVKLAMNHWKLAIDTHNTNFPNTIHSCTDISACRPEMYPSTDILITSPECTNHSLAKGVKIAKKQMDLYATGELDAAAERSRATMWDVPRFAEYHNYNAIIVENVVDARKWVMFDSWLHAMYALGYLHKCVYLNSMHCHPTPQSRDRMYVVFWKKGNKAPALDYTPLSHCSRCGKDVEAVQTWKKHDVKFGKYRQQYVYCCPACRLTVEPYYHAAFNCIDWSDIGIRIGDRSKALSPNTVRRIEYGLKKYGNQPLQVVNYTPGYVKPATDATATMTTNDHHGLLVPFVINDQHSTGIDCRVRGANEVLNAATTTPHFKLVTPHPFIIQTVNGEEHQHRSKSIGDASFTHTTLQSQGIVHPFIFKTEHSHAANSGKVKSTSGAMQTQTGCQSAGMVTPPFITISRGKSSAIHSTDALNTVSTGGIHSGIVTSEAWQSFISAYYNGSHCTKHISQDIGTATGVNPYSIVNYQTPQIEDCYYRMLKPHEIKLAMAFGADYKVLGSGRDQVKQLGNAVTPPAMEWLVKQVVKSLQ